MRSNRLVLILGLSVVSLASAAWLVASVAEMHDRLARVAPPLAIGFDVAAAAVVLVSGGAAARLLWKFSRPEANGPSPIEGVIQAAEVQAQKAEGVIAKVQDEPARVALTRELDALRADREVRRFHVVVFGTGSAGKTSLINAMLGRAVGAVGPTLGTTRRGEDHSHTIEGVDSAVVLTDTPGLSEIGMAGAAREAEARDLAARADLLLFVVDHDLVRSEHEPLLALARRGKRSILALNKSDRLSDEDRDAILARLRQRLAGVVAAEDVVAISAAPRPTSVRVVGPDGTVSTEWEQPAVDLGPLRGRIAAVLSREGDELRAANLLLRAHLLGQAAQEQVGTERDRKAQAVVDRFQWITAGTVFTNPIPALDLMATGAVQFQMISEIAAVYGVELTAGHARTIGSQMIQMLLKLGIIEASSSLVAGLFKSTLVGYAAGGAVQMVTMAYLTHISGLTFREYFRRGQDWGDGGMQAALARQFDLHSRAEFLQEFAKQAITRVGGKVFNRAKSAAEVR